MALPVVVEVGGRDLRAAEPGLGLEAYGYAFDASERLVDAVATAANLDLAQVGARIRDRGVQVHSTFTLPPGRYSLRFLVRETSSGRTGSQWLDVNVPVFDASEVLLLPPLFMDAPAEWVILKAPSRSQPALAPFVMGGEEFTPRARPLLVNGRDENVCLLAYDGGRRYDPGASFEIRPSLLDASGAAVPTGRFQMFERPGRGRRLPALRAPLHPPGAGGGELQPPHPPARTGLGPGDGGLPGGQGRIARLARERPYWHPAPTRTSGRPAYGCVSNTTSTQ